MISWNLDHFNLKFKDGHQKRRKVQLTTKESTFFDQKNQVNAVHQKKLKKCK